MAEKMKPTFILKKYFGLREDQNNASFVKEPKALRGDEGDPSEGYKELVILAAEELGVEID